jgi:hypothetical protein
VLTTDELIARAVARHRAKTQQAAPATNTPAPQEPATPAPSPQQKEPEVSENAQNDSIRRQFTLGVERKQADAIKRYKAAQRTEQKSPHQKDRGAVTGQAADSIRRDGSRNL